MKSVIVAVLAMLLAVPVSAEVSDAQSKAAIKSFKDTGSTAEADALLADATISKRLYIDLMDHVKLIDAFGRKDTDAVGAYVAEVTAPDKVDISLRARFLLAVSSGFRRIGDHQSALDHAQLVLDDPELEPQSLLQLQALMHKVAHLRSLKRYEETIATAKIVASSTTENSTNYVMNAHNYIVMTAPLADDTESAIAASNAILEITNNHQFANAGEMACQKRAINYLTSHYIKTNNEDALVSLMAKQLDLIYSPNELHADLFGAVLTGNSTLLLWASDAQAVLEAHKAYMRESEGRINTEMMSRIVQQLDTGGDLRAFAIGNAEASILAKLDPNAVSYPYTSAMLEGRFEDAIRAAHGFATSPDATDKNYAQWMQAASAAIRCLDQAYNGRAVEFLRWANGDKNEDGSPVANPVADILNL